jgi:hypothetical protein
MLFVKKQSKPVYRITDADRNLSVKNNSATPGKVLLVNTDDDDKNSVLDK